MCTFRDVVIFLAGVMFFHTVSHLMLPMYVKLPWDVGFMTLTAAVNCWIIAVSAVITIALLWYACRLGRKSC